MKAESTVKPAVFEILPYENDDVEVLFFENIKTIQPADEDETIKYGYDYYRLIVKNRENLSKSIESNISPWINLAKEKEAEISVQKVTLEQQNRADIDYIAIMTGVDL